MISSRLLIMRILPIQYLFLLGLTCALVPPLAEAAPSALYRISIVIEMTTRLLNFLRMRPEFAQEVPVLEICDTVRF